MLLARWLRNCLLIVFWDHTGVYVCVFLCVLERVGHVRDCVVNKDERHILEGDIAKKEWQQGVQSDSFLWKMFSWGLCACVWHVTFLLLRTHTEPGADQCVPQCRSIKNTPQNSSSNQAALTSCVFACVNTNVSLQRCFYTPPAESQQITAILFFIIWLSDS